MVRSTVVMHSRINATRMWTNRALGEAIYATGRDIRDGAKANMIPGHAYDTGYMHDHTVLEPAGPYACRVHVDAWYAAYPELGSSRYAARPFLMPAIMVFWPDAMIIHFKESMLRPFGSKT